MKKTISLLLIVALISVFAAFSFAGCGLFNTVTADEAVAKLTDAKYQVTVMTGAEYVESNQYEFEMISASDLQTYIYAVKGDDVIKMFFFDSLATADAMSNYINDDKLLSGQSNELIYLATKQARKDVGL